MQWRWHNQICTFSILVITLSSWIWQECRPKHVGENIVDKIQHKYWSEFVGCLYIMDMINALKMEFIAKQNYRSRRTRTSIYAAALFYFPATSALSTAGEPLDLGELYSEMWLNWCVRQWQTRSRQSCHCRYCECREGKWSRRYSSTHS
jgi:hypothetical protein